MGSPTLFPHPLHDATRPQVLGVTSSSRTAHYAPPPPHPSLPLFSRPATRPQVLGVTSSSSRADLEHLLASSHVVSLHCPLTPATRGLIGPRELGLMRPDALLINASRGSVVQRDALWEALQVRYGSSGCRTSKDGWVRCTGRACLVGVPYDGVGARALEACGCGGSRRLVAVANVH